MAKLISVGQILDQTWEHYTKHFKTIMKISLWFFLIALLMILGNFLTPVNLTESFLAEPQTNVGSSIGFVLIILTSLLVYPILAIWIFLSLIPLIQQQTLKQKIEAKTAGLAGVKKFFHYILILIIKMLAVLLAVVVMIPGIALSIYGISQQGGPWVGSISVLLLFFGAVTGLAILIYISVKLAFIGYSLMLENKKHWYAIKDSMNLTRGRFWSVLWRLFVPKLIFGVAAMLIQGFIFFAAMPLLNVSALSVEASLRITDIIYYLVASGMSVIFVPLLVIADYKIYDNLRKNPTEVNKAA